MRLVGKEIGVSTIMKIFTSQTMAAPMRSPNRWQIDWGMISAKKRIASVEMTKPIRPLVSSAVRIEKSAFAAVFPVSSVQSK
jgi:hypothetical protein